MKKLFLILVIASLLSAITLFAVDKKDESKIKLQKVLLKHSLATHKVVTKDAYFQEGFEGDFPPAGWQNLGTEAFWQQSSNAFSGSYSAYHNDDNISASESDSLITPAIDLTSAITPIFSFVQKEKYPGWYEKHQVLISTDEESWTKIYTGVASTDWEAISISLSDYVGQTIWIAFVYTGDYADEWYIDDVVVDEAPTDPIMSLNYTSIDFGLITVDSVSEYDEFIVKNDGVGTLEFTSISGFDGTDFYTDLDQTITLAPAEADTFAVGFQPLSEGQQNAELVIESNGGTDTITVSGFGIDESDKYVEGFESDVPPTDWTTNVISGTNDWEQYQANYAIDGEYIAKYDSRNALSGSSSELITPKLDLTSVDNPYIAFYFAHPTTSYDDSLGVFFSDGDTNWVHVATLLVQDYSWHSYGFYVSDYVENIVDSTNFKVKFVAYSHYGESLLLDHIILPQIYVSNETIDWCNLQSPPTLDITQGDSISVYSQVYVSGVTEGEGQGAGIESWIGFSDTDSDPATWDDSQWEEAQYNEFGPTGNKDEYMFGKIIDLPAGTYYYAFRYRYNSGTYSYGAYSASGGGFWDGTTNVSGVMTVNPYTITTFPYTEGFESGQFPPLGWSNPDGYWSLGTETHSGDYCARVSYSHDGEADLITPAITLDATETMYISFYWKDDDISTNGVQVAGHDTTFFEISTDAGMTWTGLDTISQASRDTEYHLVTDVLADYVGQTVMFRWRDVTDATYSAWGTGVDDITIDYYAAFPGEPINPVPEDGATDVPLDQVISWENPTATFFNVLYFSNGDKAAVENMDSSAVVFDGSADTTVISNITLEDGLPGNSTIYWRVVEYASDGSYTAGPVWSFTTVDDMHSAPFDLEALGKIGKVDLVWNFIPPTESGSYQEGFETGDIPEGAAVVDGDGDGNNWAVWDAFVHTGMYALASFSYENNSGALTPDNWIISPAIDLGDTPELTFYMGASDSNWYQEHFELRVSTVGQDTSTFTDVLLDETLGTDAAGQFKMFTVDLSAYANQTVYLAWEHNRVTDQFNITLDDIKITGIAEGKTLNFTFEDPKQASQFVITHNNNHTLPLKKTSEESSSSFKERIEKYVATHKGRIDLPKSLTNFNIYRNDNLICTSDTTAFTDTEFPAYNQSYSYYVTAMFDDGVESPASNTADAFVLDPSQVIFYDNYDNGELPPYYTVVDANNDGYTWQAYGGLAESGDYSMSIHWNSSEAMNDWAYIGPISMHSGDQDYYLNFGYRVASSTYPENLAVYLTDGIDSSKTIVQTLFDSTGISNTEYAHFGVNFQPTAEGEYYIAFQGYSDADMFRLAVDDILLMGDGELTQSVSATFQVDMSLKARNGFNPATQNVYVAGNFTDWGSNPIMMSDSDGDSVYTVTLDSLSAGDSLFFKFIYGDQGTTDYTWETIDNREFTPEVGDNIYTTYWNDIGPGLCGDADVDGTVYAYDAALTLQHAIGLITLSEQGAINANVNEDSLVSAFDAALILRHVVELPEPVATCFGSKDTPWSLPEEYKNNLNITTDNVSGTTYDFRISGINDEDHILSLTFDMELSEPGEAGIVNIPEGYVTGINRIDSLHYRVGVINAESLSSEDMLFRIDFVEELGIVTLSNVRLNGKLIDGTTGINSENEVIKEFRLVGNYPNPFNPTTKIAFEIPKRSRVEITIYNLLGQKVTTLVNREYTRGRYEVQWNAGSGGISSGMYIAEMKAGSYRSAIKMSLLK